MSLQPAKSQQIQIGKEIINELFAVMKLAYPTFLKGQDVDDAKRFWFTQLGAYDPARIREAMSAMTEIHPTFAPTIGEFKQLLKSGARPLAIAMTPICPTCHSTRNSQHHANVCGASK